MTNVQPMPWLGWGDKALRGYPTLGEALEQHGFRTGAFSANQVYFTSNVGLGRGFIRFEDYFQSPLDMLLRTFWGQEFDRIYLRRTEHSRITRALRRWTPALLEHRKRADEVNREALAWIDGGLKSHPAQDGKPRPFFAFLNYIDVHDVGTERWRHSARASDFTGFARDYDNALTYVDSQIGDLLRQLQERGLSKNTLIVLTSDHGESLGQHEMEFHGIALYLEQIHVPLLVVYPGRVPAGTRIATPVSNLDTAATVLSLVDPPQNIFPHSDLAALWSENEKRPAWPNPVSELGKNEIAIPPDGQAREDEPTALDGDMRSVITPQWHLVWHQDRGEQLYDWVRDPGELNNLVNTPEGRETAEKLTSELSREGR
jgi:arylsulfatase A-like enzyme